MMDSLYRVCLLTTFLFLQVGYGDSWAPPQKIELQSVDDSWSGFIRPVSREDLQEKLSATAILEGPESEITYQLDNQPTQALLLNDGRLVTFDNWASVGHGDNVVVLYSNDGELLWKKSLEDLIGKNPSFRAPTSTSSIWWRSHATEPRVDDATNSLAIGLWNENLVLVSLEDGSSTILEVESHELGDAPERLMNRAKSLSREGEHEEAADIFKQVLTLDPGKLYAYVELARCNDRLSKHAETVTILSKGLDALKGGNLRGSNMANFHCALAEAYQKSGKHDLAEKHFRTAIEVGDTYFYPVARFIGLLKEQNRRSEIGQLLSAYYRASQQNQYKSKRAAIDVADYYYSEKNYSEAVKWYEKMYSPDTIGNQFAYVKMAASYEALGRKEDALRVHHQLIRYWEENATVWKRRLEESREAVKRLRE